MSKLFGGGAPKGPSKADKEAQRRQAEELATLKSQEEKKKAALARKRSGRASLISGEEGGTKDTLGG